MAQAIVLLCDVHLNEKSERVEAKTYTWQGLEFDLCNECLGYYPISTLDQIASDYGRKPANGTKTRRKKTQQEQPAPKPKAEKVDGFKCPYCPVVRPTERGRNAHIGQKHKDKVGSDG